MPNVINLKFLKEDLKLLKNSGVVFAYSPKDIIGFSLIETTRTLSSNEIDRAKSHRLLELCKKKNKRNGLKKNCWLSLSSLFPL